MRRTLLSLALPALALACAQPAPPDPEAARTALRQADSAYTKAGLAKDRAAFVGLYAADAVMYPPEVAPVSGLDAIGKFVDGFLADPTFAGSFQPLEVEVSTDGTIGYTLNAATLTYTGTDKKLVTERLRDFHVWRRQADGSWKLVVDIWNAEPPAAPPAK